MTRSGEGIKHSMAGVLEAFSLRAFLSILLVASFFTISIGSADPWWRPKEWAVFLVGSLWLVLRKPQGEHPKLLDLFKPLMAWIVAQTFFLHALPVILAKGRFTSTPWVWMCFLSVIVLWVWFTDVCTLKGEHFKPIWKLLAIIGTVLAVHMFLQAVSLDPMLWLMNKSGKVTWLSSNHVVGLMGNSFQATACLAITVPCMVALNWRVPACLSMAMMLFTQSASGLLSAGLGALIVLWMQGKRTTVKWMAGVGAIAILCVPKLLSFSGRIPIWEKSLELWRENFFLMGTGLGTYKLLGITAPTGNGEPNVVRWAHNEFLQIGMELGFVGLVLFTSAFALLTYAVLATNAVKPEPTAILATGAVLCVSSIPLHLAPVAVTLTIALAATLVHQKEAFSENA